MGICSLIVKKKSRGEVISGIMGDISISNMDLDIYGLFFQFDSCFGYK